jgi:hypothetical protein
MSRPSDKHEDTRYFCSYRGVSIQYCHCERETFYANNDKVRSGAGRLYRIERAGRKLQCSGLNDTRSVEESIAVKSVA